MLVESSEFNFTHQSCEVAYHKVFVNSSQNRAKQSDSPSMWIAERISEKPLFLRELCDTKRTNWKDAEAHLKYSKVMIHICFESSSQLSFLRCTATCCPWTFVLDSQRFLRVRRSKTTAAFAVLASSGLGCLVEPQPLCCHAPMLGHVPAIGLWVLQDKIFMFYHPSSFISHPRNTITIPLHLHRLNYIAPIVHSGLVKSTELFLKQNNAAREMQWIIGPITLNVFDQLQIRNIRDF